MMRNYIKDKTSSKPKHKNKTLSYLFPWQNILVARIAMSDEKAVRYIPHLIFLTLLGLAYIANNYYSERMINRITTLENEVENLRVDYTTTKYEFIQMSKYMSIADKAERLGLRESTEPLEVIGE